jgi:hypothetical protein
VQQLTVTELVAAAKTRGTFPELPPLTDGTWQPNSTHNLFLWMGAIGGLFDLLTPTEEDNLVLTKNMQASLDIAACEAVSKWAADKPGAAARADALDAGGRELMLAQVSDSTGWNPWLGEVNYSLNHAQAAIDAAKACIDAPQLRGPKARRIDLASGAVLDDGPSLDAGTRVSAPAPFEVKVNAPGRAVAMSWSRLSNERLELTVDADAGIDHVNHRTLSLTFPMSFDHIVYSPALDEGVLQDLPATDFAPGVEHTLPAPSGLVGLGPNRFLLKDTRAVHVVFLVRPDAGEVELRDDTIRVEQPAHWRFEIVDAPPERAVQIAQQVNVTPVIEYSLAPREGCGCEASPGGILLALAFALRLHQKVRLRPRH